MRKEIIKQLSDLKAPKSNKGFEYIVKSIELCCSDRNNLYKFTKLYEKVAKEFNTSSSKVERAIRHEIEIIFEDSSVAEELKLDIFGTVDRRCNSEFIACMVYHLTEK